jgi:hypothetical protein
VATSQKINVCEVGFAVASVADAAAADAFVFAVAGIVAAAMQMEKRTKMGETGRS